MKTYDLSTAADFLKVSPDTMRDLADSGDIPGAKVGKQWVFREDDLDDYLSAKVKEQTEARRNAFFSGKKPRVDTAATSIRERRNSRRMEPPELPSLPVAA